MLETSLNPGRLAHKFSLLTLAPQGKAPSLGEEVLSLPLPLQGQAGAGTPPKPHRGGGEGSGVLSRWEA